MNRRIAVEVSAAVVVALAFFWWLYLRPEPGPPVYPPGSNEVARYIETRAEKLVIIAVDGLDWEVAAEVMGRGEMPNLENLVRGGAHGVLNFEGNMIPESAWTTMATGFNEDEHGIDNETAKVPFRYEQVRMGSDFREKPALWEMADWAGKKAAVVNWAGAFPAQDLNGVFVAEGVLPGKVEPDLVRPKDRMEKVKSAPLPRFIPYEEELVRMRDGRLAAAYDFDRYVFSVALETMREVRPDLLMVNFKGLDTVSRAFWKHRGPVGIDRAYQVSEEERDRFGRAIDLHYRFIDRLIGGLLSECEGYNAVVVSAFGIGGARPEDELYLDLNNLLERLGYLEYEGRTCDQVLTWLHGEKHITAPPYVEANIFTLCTELSEEADRWRSEGKNMPAFAVEAFISRKYKFSPAEDDYTRDLRSKALNDLATVLAKGEVRQDIYWSETFAWNPEDSHKEVRGIYLNLEAREPEGTVPASEFNSTRSALIGALRDLRSENNERLFKRVWKNREKDPMPMGISDEPDILLTVNRAALSDNLLFNSARDRHPIPVSAVRWAYSDISGVRTGRGFYAFRGPLSPEFKRVDMGSLDFAPTMLWVMGMPVGQDLGGEVLLEAFSDAARERRLIYIESYEKALGNDYKNLVNPAGGD